MKSEAAEADGCNTASSQKNSLRASAHQIDCSTSTMTRNGQELDLRTHKTRADAHFLLALDKINAAVRNATEDGYGFPAPSQTVYEEHRHPWVSFKPASRARTRPPEVPIIDIPGQHAGRWPVEALITHDGAPLTQLGFFLSA